MNIDEIPLNILHLLAGVTPENIRSYGGRVYPKTLRFTGVYNIKNDNSVLGYGIYEILIKSEEEFQGIVKIKYYKGASYLCIIQQMTIKKGTTIVPIVNFKHPILDIPGASIKIKALTVNDIKKEVLIYTKGFYYPLINRALCKGNIINIQYKPHIAIGFVSNMFRNYTDNMIKTLNLYDKEWAYNILEKHIDIIKQFIYRPGGKMYNKSFKRFKKNIQ